MVRQFSAKALECARQGSRADVRLCRSARSHYLRQPTLHPSHEYQADCVETLCREQKPPFSGWRRRVFAPPRKISLLALPKAFRGELKRHFGPHRRINGLPGATARCETAARSLPKLSGRCCNLQGARALILIAKPQLSRLLLTFSRRAKSLSAPHGGGQMILPSRNIAPERALLTIAGTVFQRLSEPATVSRIWDDLRSEYQRKPISYSWFVLAVDLLFVMDLVWFDQDGLLRRSERRN
jgi:hypothetical protein